MWGSLWGRRLNFETITVGHRCVVWRLLVATQCARRPETGCVDSMPWVWRAWLTARRRDRGRRSTPPSRTWPNRSSAVRSWRCTGVVQRRSVGLAGWGRSKYCFTVSPTAMSRTLKVMGYVKLSARRCHEGQNEHVLEAFRKKASPTHWRCSRPHSQAGETSCSDYTERDIHDIVWANNAKLRKRQGYLTQAEAFFHKSGWLHFKCAFRDQHVHRIRGLHACVLINENWVNSQ